MNWKKYENKATTITIGNQKGGVSKTTTSCLLGYSLAKIGIRTLVVDLDPQSNATKLLMLTNQLNNENITIINKTLMKGIQDNNLEDIPVNIIDNLDLLPSFIDFEDFPKFLFKNTNTDLEEDFYLSNLIKPLKKKYDLILIDVPPMSLEITKNAVTSSDFILIALQTQERALTGAENYVKQLVNLQRKYNLDLEVIGVLQVLLKNNGSIDKYIQNKSIEIFGENNIFKTIIPQMERIKRFDVTGITDEDMHDKKVLNLYSNLANELLSRLELFNKED